MVGGCDESTSHRLNTGTGIDINVGVILAYRHGARQESQVREGSKW
jgi:hypothetical protein